MDDFLSYFENQKFIHWTYRSDRETEVYWNGYLHKYPEEKEKIEQARLILSQLRSKKIPEDPAVIYELYAAILQNIDRKKKTSKSRKIWISFAKYAAVALVFLSVGILRENFKEQSPLLKFGNQYVERSFPKGNNAYLIMSDGERIAISDKESNVTYSEDGRIIINKHDTIKNKTISTSPEINQLIIPYGMNSSIQLFDGTVVFLNAGSRLVYPSFFEGKNREVFLIGEGFFIVAHNPDMPFIVKTTDLSVEALGTNFNVAAYPQDKVTEVVLVEGKVGLCENAFKLPKKRQILEPDQLASFNHETMKTSIKNISPENYTAWHKGYLNFESTDLSRVVLKLERYYDIQIKFRDPMMGQRKITGKLKLKEDKDKVLQVLASTASSDLVKHNEQNYLLK